MASLNWDLLAPIWDKLQCTGFAPHDLEPFASKLSGPCILVGAGQGLVAPLLQRTAKPLLALDRSLPMAQLAWAKRQLRVVVADGMRIPVADGWAGSIVINTGVLDPSNREGCSAILAETRRALRPDGRAIVNGFVPAGDWKSFGEEIGTLDGSVQRNDRLLEIWKRGKDVSALRSLISRWTGCSAEEAAERWARHAEALRGLIRLFEGIAIELRALGHQPEPYLAKAYGGPFHLFAANELLDLVRSAGFSIVEQSDAARTRGISILLCGKNRVIS